MNYNKKLESLAKEYEATMNHADKVMNEIIATAFEQAMVEAFNELTEEEQMIIVLGLLGYFPIPTAPQQPSPEDELVNLLASIEQAAREEEQRRYEEERKREFFKELDEFLTKEREMLAASMGLQMNGRLYSQTAPESTFLEVGLPADVLNHLKRLGVKF